MEERVRKLFEEQNGGKSPLDLINEGVSFSPEYVVHFAIDFANLILQNK